MKTATFIEPVHALRRAAASAMLAPSVHNTQPWHMFIDGTALELHADQTRQLTVLDPTGRQLMISCGCALFNARVALATAGYRADVERFPDAERPDLLARLTVIPELGANSALAALEPLIAIRRTNRRRFNTDAVDSKLVEQLVADATAEGALLLPITRPEHRLETAVLSQRADREQNSNPAYRAEIRHWTTEDPDRRDGVPGQAVPHVDGSAYDDLPIRDFDTHGTGSLPVETHSSSQQCLLLLCSFEDNPLAWLRSGEALQHILLEIVRHGYVASPLTQVVEVPSTRQMLRQRLDLDVHPDILLRVGRALPTPATRRRPSSDVVTNLSRRPPNRVRPRKWD